MIFLYQVTLKINKEGTNLTKWNEQSAPNNNLSSVTIKSSKLVNKDMEHEFSEELSDGGERNELIEKQRNKSLKL